MKGGLCNRLVCLSVPIPTSLFPPPKYVNLLNNFKQSLVDWAAELLFLLFYSYIYIPLVWRVLPR